MSIEGEFRTAAEGEDQLPVWKTTVGRFTFYNATPAEIVAPLIEDIPLADTVVRNAFVSRRSNARLPGGPRCDVGAVYAKGKILPEFGERNAWQRDVLSRPVRDPEQIGRGRIDRAEKLPGTHVYLGFLKNQFGHFITESLPRAWRLIGLDSSVGVVFHHPGRDVSFTGFRKTIMDALGVPAERVTAASRDLLVENLIVPNCQFWLQGKGSPGLCRVFDYLAEKLGENKQGGRTAYPEKIYLTRESLRPELEAKLEEDDLSEFGRSVIVRKLTTNEGEIEAIFRARGFEIISPETLPFEEQVALIRNATHIAGIAGSATHMVMFNNNPHAKIIVLHTRPVHSQINLNGLRGIESHHISCLLPQRGGRVAGLDAHLVKRALAEIV